MIKMNLRLYIIYTAAVISLISPAFAGSTATIHGAVYKWDTFEPLDNAVIEINSTPIQYMVAKNGLYSVGLVPGNYIITAKYYQNGILTYSTDETIKIEDGGTYVLDLLLPPVDSKEPLDGSKENIFSEKLNKSEKDLSQNAKNPMPEATIYRINDSRCLDITEQPLESPTDNLKPRDRSQIWPQIENVFLFSDLTNDLGGSPTKQSKFYSPIIYYLLIVLTYFVLLVGTYRFLKGHKHLERNAFHKGKDEYVIKYLLEFLNLPEFLVKPFATTVESKEKYSVQVTELVETELVGLRPETENREIFLEEPVYNSKTEAPALKQKRALRADLQEVMDVIRSQGGQVSQKNLRGKLKYSEVKVSLMLSDLEKRKRIKKFKRGRENIVFLIG
jgi:uncharacterized membrane protein